MLILSRVLSGLGNSLFSVTASPFLMEQSTESERTYLFSFNSGISTVSSFAGNFVGGMLPAFFALRLGVSPQSSSAYAWSMGVTTVLMGLSLIPLVFLRSDGRRADRKPAMPFRSAWEQRGIMTKLLLPSLIISVGAGLLIPFMNLFFRSRFMMSDGAIGQLFGFGALGMGIAFLVAPVLAERWGKARMVVITQGLSVPFLIILGFVPNLPLAILAYLVRMALMNLSSPVYQTLVMEEVDENSRGMAASLYSMIWNFGRAISPSVSGPIQVAYGFNPIFVATIVMYALSVYLLYIWFVRGRTRPAPTWQLEG
jgi:MFS family permease